MGCSLGEMIFPTTNWGKLPMVKTGGRREMDQPKRNPPKKKHPPPKNHNYVIAFWPCMSFFHHGSPKNGRSIIRDSITTNNMELTDFKRHSSGAPGSRARGLRTRGLRCFWLRCFSSFVFYFWWRRESPPGEIAALGAFLGSFGNFGGS